jgi:hypothetical protein
MVFAIQQDEKDEQALFPRTSAIDIAKLANNFRNSKLAS